MVTKVWYSFKILCCPNQNLSPVIFSNKDLQTVAVSKTIIIITSLKKCFNSCTAREQCSSGSKETLCADPLWKTVLNHSQGYPAWSIKAFFLFLIYWFPHYYNCNYSSWPRGHNSFFSDPYLHVSSLWTRRTDVAPITISTRITNISVTCLASRGQGVAILTKATFADAWWTLWKRGKVETALDLNISWLTV